jgi:hypothetical protein
MKHKTFRICCRQHHRMATYQPHVHMCNTILVDTSLAGLLHTTHLPPPPSYSKCTVLPMTPPLLLQRQRGFGCCQQVMASLHGGCAQFERQRHSGVSKLCPMASHCPSFSSNGLVTRQSHKTKSPHFHNFSWNLVQTLPKPPTVQHMSHWLGYKMMLYIGWLLLPINLGY